MSDSAVSSTPAPLDYAPAPPRRRKWIRRGAWTILAVALLVCSWRWGPFAWRRAHVLYWQHQCMVFTLPPDTVVYEEEPAAAAKLIAANPRSYLSYPLYRKPRADLPAVQTQAAALSPQCWRSLSNLFNLPSQWIYGLGSYQPVLFLHESTSPAGHRRLICVRFITGYNVLPLCITPWTLTQDPAPAAPHDSIDVVSWFPKTPPKVRFYAGQPDPIDPSHFTIRYQMWGQEDVVDGRVDDKDVVTLTPRKIPTEPR